ncbi:MAG TPA: NUDIX domain-containing protein [Bacteroidia bacterium]|nr:NUDIX domain-containing protein [Bacteroidia bacterium]HNS13029.1 NUDIX domain-containing protein [Bacteroidia bacterium]
MKELKFQAFVNDKLISFTDVYSVKEQPNFPGLHVLSDANNSLEEAISKLEKKEDWKGLVFLSSNPKRIWEEFVSGFSLQEAAGGLVENENKEYLLIFRRGKWDLPKGKIDYSESPEEAAIREVKEECGLENIELGPELDVTFHTYSEKKKRVLKKTYWYLMRSSKDEKLIPQTEEDIDIVEWMTEDQIKKNVFGNTFFSIKKLLSMYFENQISFKSDKA